MPSDDRDEPSFVTNVERTIDLEDRSEVGTLPRPPKLFAEDEEERVEKTLLLATSEPAPVVTRPPMHSEVAGQWIAPAPPPGFVPPITSDTAAFARTELAAPPPHLPTPPPYLTPAPVPAKRPRGPGVFVFLGAMLVVGLAGGGLVAWKLDVLPHAQPTTSTPPAPAPSAAPEPPPVAPSATTTEAPSAAPSASAPPAASGKHPRRRPRKGR